MFGRRKRTAHHHDGTTITTTTHTTRTAAPHYPSKASLFMNRLRPRRNTVPAHGTYGAPVATHSHAPRARRTGFGTRHRAHAPAAHHHHTTAAAAPRRKTSMGDKMSGAMLKLRGSLSGRPGVKAAGTRRMHGTDGRGSRRYY